MPNLHQLPNTETEITDPRILALPRLGSGIEQSAPEVILRFIDDVNDISDNGMRAQSLEQALRHSGVPRVIFLELMRKVPALEALAGRRKAPQHSQGWPAPIINNRNVAHQKKSNIELTGETIALLSTAFARFQGVIETALGSKAIEDGVCARVHGLLSSLEDIMVELSLLYAQLHESPSLGLVHSFGTAFTSLAEGFARMQEIIQGVDQTKGREIIPILIHIEKQITSLSNLFVHVFIEMQEKTSASVTDSSPSSGGMRIYTGENDGLETPMVHTQRTYADRYFGAASNQSLEDIPDDAQFFAMGINPSKRELHEGHWLTLFQFTELLAQRDRAKGLIFVDDREFDFQKRVRYDERIFPVPRTQDADAIENRIGTFIVQLTNQMGNVGILDRISIQKMSRYMGTREGGNSFNGAALYNLLLSSRRSIIEHFGIFDPLNRAALPNQTNFIRPICSECGEFGPRLDEHIEITRSSLRGICLRDRCINKRFSVHPHNGEHHWAMHYAVDPLRDILLSKYRNVVLCHVFGGDYGMEYGDGGTPKALRLNRLVQDIAKDQVIYHYTGPLLTRDGKKLSKSNGDASDFLDLDQLRSIIKRGAPAVEISGSIA